MKKCPYCKAEIQENARFCLYCMKSLEEKQQVSTPPKRKPFLLIAGAMLFAVLILVLACCVGGSAGDTPPEKEQGSMTPDEVVLQGNISKPTENAVVDVPAEPTELTSSQKDTEPQSHIPTETTQPVTPDPPKPTETTQPVTPDPPKQTEPTQPVTPDPPKQTETTQPVTPDPPKQTEPTQPITTVPTTQTKPAETPAQCSHRYQLTQTAIPTCTADGSNTYTCSLCGDSYRESLSATGHSYQAATCLLPQICTVCEATGSAALGHSYQSGACIRCQKADPKDPRNIYEYREASAGDQLYEGTWDPETDIVITGIKLVTDDGVYEIPATINGKRVVAICSLAFSGSDARKVTLGENLIYVAQNAFSGCYNIQALYVRAEHLYLSRSAFIPASSRNCTLKIYCSAQCTVNDALKGECYLKDIVRAYGGEFHEWNG